ncbi:MAG: T9SS type A sorting domain-containing protein [Bacteroidales bacterium]|nr:T9SS type A sorting domain-containing protein [Bacteroidales bacterium]MCF8403710.1 T9SS type A sorting domain-containing protein [Bacteroidales bacterium]
MYKFYTTFLILSFLSVTGFGQAFMFTPTDNFVGYQTVDVYHNYIVYQENLTGGELVLGWENLSHDIPGEWGVTMCDYGGCYIGIAPGGIMLPLSDTLRGLLKITVNPNGFAASGTATFRVYDNKHPEDSDTVSFTMHASGFVSISNTVINGSLQVYPNPANEWFVVDNLENTESIKIINMQGKIVHKEEITRIESKHINSTLFPAGIYFVIAESKNGIVKREKLVIQ